MLRKQRKKKGTIVVDHVELYRCFTVVSWVMRYCTTVLLMQVEVMYSDPVVIMFLLGIQTKEKKRDESPPFSSSFLAPGADVSAFQSCPSDPMIRLRSH